MKFFSILIFNLITLSSIVAHKSRMSSSYYSSSSISSVMCNFYDDDNRDLKIFVYGEMTTQINDIINEIHHKVGERAVTIRKIATINEIHVSLNDSVVVVMMSSIGNLRNFEELNFELSWKLLIYCEDAVIEDYGKKTEIYSNKSK